MPPSGIAAAGARPAQLEHMGSSSQAIVEAVVISMGQMTSPYQGRTTTGGH
jgi:hypothetical protein